MPLIEISERAHKELWRMRVELGKKSLNEVIEHLIEKVKSTTS